MYKYITVIFVFLLQYNLSFSLDTDRTDKMESEAFTDSTDLRVGFNFLLNQAKENNLIPLRHIGTGFSLNLAYRFYSQSDEKIIDWTVELSGLSTHIEDYAKSYWIKNSFSFTNVYKSDLAGIKDVYLGGKIELVHNPAYYNNLDDSHLYWATYFSLGLALKYYYELSNLSRFSFLLDASPLGFGSRPNIIRNYKMDEPSFSNAIDIMHSNFEFVYPMDFIDIRFRTSYEMKVLREYVQSLFIEFDYLKLKTDISESYINFQTKAGITFNF